MKDIIKKLPFLFNANEKKKAILLLLIVLVSVLLEMLGIGLIIPILTLLSDQEVNKFFDFEKFKTFFYFINITDQKDLIFVSIYLLLIIYFLKTAFLSFLVWFQSKFIYQLHSSIAGKLFNTYLFQDYSFHTQSNSSKLIQNVKHFSIRNIFTSEF